MAKDICYTNKLTLGGYWNDLIKVVRKPEGPIGNRTRVHLKNIQGRDASQYDKEELLKLS